MSISELRKIPRLPLPPLTSKARKLFRPSAAEIKLVARLRAKLAPALTVLKSALRGIDAKLGLKLSAVKKGKYLNVTARHGCFKVPFRRLDQSHEIFIVALSPPPCFPMFDCAHK